MCIHCPFSITLLPVYCACYTPDILYCTSPTRHRGNRIASFDGDDDGTTMVMPNAKFQGKMGRATEIDHVVLLSRSMFVYWCNRLCKMTEWSIDQDVLVIYECIWMHTDAYEGIRMHTKAYTHCTKADEGRRRQTKANYRRRPKPIIVCKFYSLNAWAWMLGLECLGKTPTISLYHATTCLSSRCAPWTCTPTHLRSVPSFIRPQAADDDDDDNNNHGYKYDDMKFGIKEAALC